MAPKSSGPTGLVDVQIIGDSRDVQMRLDALGDAFESQAIAAWLMVGLDPLLRRRTAERFDSEGDDISGKWQSLQPFTVSDRQAHGFPGEHPINVRTGSMKKHLLDDPPRVAIHTLGATMWSPGGDGGPKTAKKVKTAQEGDPATNTPARPVLGVGVVDLEAALISLAGHISSRQPGGANIFTS